jgi:hypothetical protein
MRRFVKDAIDLGYWSRIDYSTYFDGTTIHDGVQEEGSVDVYGEAITRKKGHPYRDFKLELIPILGSQNLPFWQCSPDRRLVNYIFELKIYFSMSEDTDHILKIEFSSSERGDEKLIAQRFKKVEDLDLACVEGLAAEFLRLGLETAKSESWLLNDVPPKGTWVERPHDAGFFMVWDFLPSANELRVRKDVTTLSNSGSKEAPDSLQEATDSSSAYSWNNKTTNWLSYWRDAIVGVILVCILLGVPYLFWRAIGRS